MGSTCAYPPPAAPPFIPKTGPKEGSRKATILFLPSRFNPKDKLTVVTVFPFPALVGEIAVTKTSLFFLTFSVFKLDNSIFPI